MYLRNYDLIYLSSGLIGTYTVYRLMNVFFKDKKSSRTVEIISYLAYYIFVSFLYLTINIPMVTMAANIIIFILLSYNYRATYKNRFIAIFLVYLIPMMAETVVSLLTGFLVLSVFSPSPEYSSTLGYILGKIIGFAIVLFIENFSNIKKGYQVSTSYWLSILVISFSSIYIIVVLVESQVETIKISIIISLLFIIIMLIFYLYDGLKKSAEIEIEKIVLEQEKKYYMKQFELIKSSIDYTMALKHDISNHIATIGSLVNNNKNSKVLDYMNQLVEYTDFSMEYINSGNSVIDSILNYKLDYIKTIGAEVDLEVKISSNLNLVSFDMVVILGNLLDNAIDALKKVEKNKILSISIRYEKGLLFIHIKNTFDGNIFENQNNLITLKKDRKNHGLGLRNVKSTLEKYNGTMKYNYTEDMFTMSIIMYLQ